MIIFFILFTLVHSVFGAFKESVHYQDNRSVWTTVLNNNQTKLPISTPVFLKALEIYTEMCKNHTASVCETLWEKALEIANNSQAALLGTKTNVNQKNI